jgi:hypothetical protein
LGSIEFWCILRGTVLSFFECFMQSASLLSRTLDVTVLLDNICEVLTEVRTTETVEK